MNQVQILNGVNSSNLKRISDHYSIYQETLKKFVDSLNESFSFSDFKHGKVELDKEVPGKVNIQFCLNKYQFRLFFDLSNLKKASIGLFEEIEGETDKPKTNEIGRAAIDEYGDVIIPGFQPLGKDEPFFNTVSMFFLNCIKGKKFEQQTEE